MADEECKHLSIYRTDCVGVQEWIRLVKLHQSNYKRSSLKVNKPLCYLNTAGLRNTYLSDSYLSKEVSRTFIAALSPGKPQINLMDSGIYQ